MTVEVVIPSIRQESVERLVKSLCDQSQAPDVITVVSNETQGFKVRGRPMVRLLRFESDV